MAKKKEENLSGQIPLEDIINEAKASAADAEKTEKKKPAKKKTATEEKKAAEKKTTAAEKKAAEKKTAAADKKTAEKKTTEKKSTEKKSTAAAEKKTAEKKTTAAEKKAAEKKTTAAEKKATEEKETPKAKKTADKKKTAEPKKASEKKVKSETEAEEKSATKKTSKKKTEAEPTEDKKPAAKKTAKKTEAVAEEKPATKKASKKKAEAEPTEDKKPAEDKKSAAKKTAKKTEATAEEKPAAKKASKKKAEAEPTEDKKPAEDKKSAAKKTAKKTEAVAEEKPATKKASKKKAEAEPAADKKSAADKKEPEKKTAAKKSTSKKTPEKTVTEPKEAKSKSGTTTGKGFLKDKGSKKLIEDAFADIENQLKDIDELSDKGKSSSKSKPKPEAPAEKIKGETKKKSESKKPLEKTAEKLAENPTEKPTEKPAEKPTEKPADNKKKPALKPTKDENIFIFEYAPKDGKKTEANRLPSGAKLKDIKGDRIEDFIEQTSETLIEPDEPKPAGTELRKLPKILSFFVPVQGDSIWEIIRKGLIVICAVLLIVSMAVLIKSTRASGSSGKDSEGNWLSNYVTKYTVNTQASSIPNSVLEKYYSLYNVNNDAVGWLTIPDTAIDLPVVKYTDNEYYSSRDFYQKQLTGLNAFADYRCNMQQLDSVTIVYIAAGSSAGVLSGLSDYQTAGNGSPRKIEFGTLYSDYEWTLVASLTESADDSLDLNEFRESPAELIAYLRDESENTSLEASISENDKIILVNIPYDNVSEEDEGEIRNLILVAKLNNQETNNH